MSFTSVVKRIREAMDEHLETLPAHEEVKNVLQIIEEIEWSPEERGTAEAVRDLIEETVGYLEGRIDEAEETIAALQREVEYLTKIVNRQHIHPAAGGFTGFAQSE